MPETGIRVAAACWGFRLVQLHSCAPTPVMVPPDFRLWELWAENQESGEG